MPYCLANFEKTQQFELCLSPQKQIYTCLPYAIFDSIHAQRFYFAAWRLEFAETGSPLVNEKSTFFYEVFKYYLNLLKNPHKSSIADAKVFSITWAKCSSYFSLFQSAKNFDNVPDLSVTKKHVKMY